MTDQRIIVVSGPSGVGKGTLLDAVRDSGQIRYARSMTTRPPRLGETPGEQYLFAPSLMFNTLLFHGGLVEHVSIGAHSYGIPRCELDGTDAVLVECSVEGGFAVRAAYPGQTLLVFIAPPSLDELAARLRGRGTETEAEIEVRLGRAAAELDASDRYDLVIVNDDLETARRQLDAIVGQVAGRELAA